MTKVRGTARTAVPEPLSLDAGNVDAVVLEQIFLSVGARDGGERLLLRRLLRRWLRCPAAQIASRRVKRKRMLERLGRQALGAEFAAVRAARVEEVSRALRQGLPQLRAGGTAPVAPQAPQRAGRWVRGRWSTRR